MDLKRYIADVPDFPKKGILFKDITPLLKDPAAFRYAIEEFAKAYEDEKIDVVVAIEARGFFFGAPLAYRMGVPRVPIRKPAKLPRAAVGVEYALEYGTDAVEMHQDGVQKGQRVLLIDDLLATGGTAAAAIELVEKVGATIGGVAFLVELEALNGRSKFQGYPVTSLIKY
ncbi:MAG: adenine phosphoribosyltransferase [Dehalococcoidia bacterium]